jgi:LysR family glycine cleavage system transcriptional activator
VKDGFTAFDLFEEKLVAAASPGTRFAQGHRHRLITTDIEPGEVGNDWKAWCGRTGFDLPDVGDGTWLKCTHYVLAGAMATAGLGVALVPGFMVADEVVGRQLAIVGPEPVPSGRTYRFCHKVSRDRDPAIRAFRDWIRREVRESSAVAVPRLRAS